MDDLELLTAFEAGAISAGCFHHIDHVRLAWIYLQRHSPLEALPRFATALKQFAERNGKAGLYHETITWAYFFLVNERIAQLGDNHNWQEFAAANGDLLTWKPSILDKYYRKETLYSARAKRVFVLPDLLAEADFAVVSESEPATALR